MFFPVFVQFALFLHLLALVLDTIATEDAVHGWNLDEGENR